MELNTFFSDEQWALSEFQSDYNNKINYLIEYNNQKKSWDNPVPPVDAKYSIVFCSIFLGLDLKGQVMSEC